MKHNGNEKHSVAGGRLRIGMLGVCVAVFLLVPSAMASGAVTIVNEGNGSGTVLGIEPSPGVPPINCTWNGGTAEQSGTCVSEPTVGELGPSINLEHKAAAGSKFGGWKVLKGIPLGCEEESPTAGTCPVLGSEIEVKAVFEKEPNVHITIDGDGAGTVVSEPSTSLPGDPPIDCEYASPGPQTGVCDTSATEAVLPGIGVTYELGPESEFGGWTVEEGSKIEDSCDEFNEICTVFLFTPEIKIKATFNKVVPKFKLNLTTSGSGSGSLECDTGSGAEACASEYKEGTVVNVIPVPDAGSELVEFSGDCTGPSCELTMDSEKTVDAQFDLETFAFTVEQSGEGAVDCDINGGGLGACPSSVSFGDEVEVVATPAAENVVESLTGSGSAAGSCDKEAGTCEFTVAEASGVIAAFASAKTVASEEENVHGEVPETTSLTTSCEGDVDLGEFLPGVAESYINSCALTATSTGQETDLTASDESGVDTGFLTQKPIHPYSLAQALETRATGIPALGGVGSGVYEALTSPVTLLSYPTPVSADNVTVFFRQPIGLHDPLHTGVYSKTITVTLKQTTP